MSAPTTPKPRARAPDEHSGERGINSIHSGKEETKLPLFTDDIQIYLESLKDSIKRVPRTNKRV